MRIVGEREKGGARGRHACLLLARPFFLCPLLPSACYAGYLHGSALHSIRRYCLHFSSLAYDLTHRSRGRIYELNAKVERADKVGQFVQFSALCEQYWTKYQPSKTAKLLCGKKVNLNHTFSVKFQVIRREFLRNHSVYWAHIFRDNRNCYALSIVRVFF